MTLCLYLRGRPSKEWNAKHPFSLITRYSVKEKTGLWPAFWMRIKQIPHTKNKLTGKQSKIKNTMAHNLTNLQVNKIRLQKCYGTQLDYVINIYTYIYITKGDKIRFIEEMWRGDPGTLCTMWLNCHYWNRWLFMDARTCDQDSVAFHVLRLANTQSPQIATVYTTHAEYQYTEQLKHVI